MKVELHIQPGPISDYDRLVDYLHFPRSRVARQASRASLGPSK